jgi:hypothetical protein
MSLQTKCPRCSTVNTVDEHLIGRYTLCQKCNCRFYVEVPSLESPHAGGPLFESGHHEGQAAARESALSNAVGQTSNATYRLERKLEQAMIGLTVLTIVTLINTALLIVVLVR